MAGKGDVEAVAAIARPIATMHPRVEARKGGGGQAWPWMAPTLRTFSLGPQLRDYVI